MRFHISEDSKLVACTANDDCRAFTFKFPDGLQKWVGTYRTVNIRVLYASVAGGTANVAYSGYSFTGDIGQDQPSYKVFCFVPRLVKWDGTNTVQAPISSAIINEVPFEVDLQTLVTQTISVRINQHDGTTLLATKTDISAWTLGFEILPGQILSSKS